MHMAAHATETFLLGKLPYRPIPELDANVTRGHMFSSNPSRARVLCFSRDRVLGETRRAVLDRRYDAVLAGSLETVGALTSSVLFDVIVLCHTLSVEDCQRCLEILSRVGRMAKIVAVTVEGGSKQPTSDQSVRGLAGPQALLDAVQQVLLSSLPAVVTS